MMYALPSYVWRVRKARAAMGKKERNRHRWDTPHAARTPARRAPHFPL